MKCRICGAETDPIYDEKFDNTYGYCKQCEFIGIETNDLISFDEERNEYDRHENSIENEGYVGMFKRFLDNAVMPFVEDGDGLDFGSGPEPVLTQVIERDYKFKMDHYDLHYQPTKVYEDKSYDLIVSTEVAEHLQDPMMIFELLSKHLNQDGIVAIMTLFHTNDHEAFLKWWYRRDITHIGFFTPRTFEVIAKKVGMEVIYTDHKRYITLRKV